MKIGKISTLGGKMYSGRKIQIYTSHAKTVQSLMNAAMSSDYQAAARFYDIQLTGMLVLFKAESIQFYAPYGQWSRSNPHVAMVYVGAGTSAELVDKLVLGDLIEPPDWLNGVLAADDMVFLYPAQANGYIDAQIPVELQDGGTGGIRYRMPSPDNYTFWQKYFNA